MEEYDTLVLRSSHHRVEQGIHITRRNFSREACPKCTLEIAPELAHLNLPSLRICAHRPLVEASIDTVEKR